MTLSKKHTPMLKKARVFTLIEILAALTILAIGVGTIFLLVGSSSRKLNAAKIRWTNQHLLNNAVEYFLLVGHEQTFPGDMLPEGYRITCDFEIYEDIPEDSTPENAPGYAFENPLNNWYLGLYTIKLYKNGDLIGQQKVEKIVRDEE